MAQPSDHSSLKEERACLKQVFLETHKAPSDLALSFLAGDCSFRTYERLRTQQNWFAPHVVLMDAPPPLENISPFLKIAEILQKAGLRVPQIYASDQKAGFVLLEDWGDLTYKRALEKGFSKKDLYKTAIDALFAIQKISVPDLLDPFDTHVLIRELESFFHWGLDRPLSPFEKERARQIWGEVLAPLTVISAQQPSLVLRDYHVENLIVLPGKGVSSCGLLDFQDALWGTKAYDLVSILQDARFDVGEVFEQEMKDYFLRNQGPSFDVQAFETAYTLLGLQRSVKILGIFLRHARKGGRTHMLEHVPRVWQYIQRGLASPLASPLAGDLTAWFQEMFSKGRPHG